MYPGGFTAQVTSLSPKATERDVYDFFSHCGSIVHVEVIRSSEYGCTAYVTFKDGYALETAVLFSGATIVDRRVSIARWGTCEDESDPWNSPSWRADSCDASTGIHVNQFASTPGEAVTVAQEVVKTMIAKGYDVGKDAFLKAKAFDESHQVSSTASAKIAELSNRIGLTDKIHAGIETAKSIDEKYQVSDFTKSAASVTGNAAVAAASFTARTASAAATAAVNSSYFANGALWVSGVLTRAAAAAAELGNRAGK